MSAAKEKILPFQINTWLAPVLLSVLFLLASIVAPNASAISGAAGGAAAGIVSNAAAGFAGMTVQGLASGESIGQSLELGGIGAAWGVGFGAFPAALDLGAAGAGMAGQYAGAFWGGFSNADIEFSLGSGVGGDFLQRLDAGIQAAAGGNAAENETAQATSLWTRAEVSGVRVYQRSDLIDPNRIDIYGRTNLQRMQEGYAPIGPDGQPINLHHILQTNDSPLAELTDAFHRQNAGILHINPRNAFPSGINRAAFNSWRQSYWMTRANDFLPGGQP